MPIKVFISATRMDLGPDLVKAAKQAVTNAKGSTVDMETWDTDFQPAVQVCRQKLQASTHYLGIFAYRRGWVPNELKAAKTELDYDQSVTELEYVLAGKHGMKMAVFVPVHGSYIAQQLEMRAKDQTEEEGRAQRAFLERVQASGKALMPFDSETFLYIKANQRAQVWARGGIRNAQDTSPPTGLDFSTLGRLAQRQVFQSSLGKLSNHGYFPPSAFLIHGPPGHGHQYVVSRLARLIKEVSDEPPDVIRVTVGAAWQRGGLDLVEQIASRFSEDGPSVHDASLESIEALAQRADDVLTRRPLVVIIERVQRLGTEGLGSVVDRFWKPLIEKLPDELLNRLVVLMTLEAADEPAVTAVTAADALDGQAFDPSLPIALPRLAQFDKADLVRWFIAQRMERIEAESEASTLFAETSGNPAQVFVQLMS